MINIPWLLNLYYVVATDVVFHIIPLEYHSESTAQLLQRYLAHKDVLIVSDI